MSFFLKLYIKAEFYIERGNTMLASLSNVKEENFGDSRNFIEGEVLRGEGGGNTNNSI